MGAGVAQAREAHGNNDGQDGGAKKCQSQSGEHNRDKAVRAGEPQISERRAYGQERHDAAPGAGAVGELSPQRLRDDAHKRHDSQDPTELSTRQAGVFLEVKTKIRKKDPEGAHVDKPEEGERYRTPHGAILASLFVMISYIGDNMYG